MQQSVGTSLGGMPVLPRAFVGSQAAYEQICAYGRAMGWSDKPFDFVVDAVLVAAFFAFMYGILRPHVPSNEPSSIIIWAGLTSACMSGVFWLSCWMFRMVYRHQKVLNAAKK